MAETEISFTRDLTRHFYTAYRPIILDIYCSDTDVAFIRAELYVQYTNGGTWMSTGVLMNAYQKANNPDKYSMNIMEYCRPYISTTISHIYTYPGWSVHPSSGESARFYVHAWPVRYSSTAIGQLIDDMPGGKDSKECIVVALNTDEKTSTAYGGGYTDIDKYVLSKNGNIGAVPNCMPMTNMPFPTLPPDDPMQDLEGFSHGNTGVNDARPDGWGISVDMEDSWHPATYYLNGQKNKNYCTILVKNLAGKVYAGFGFDLVYAPSPAVDMQKIQWHPIAMENFITLHMGSSLNKIIDASGNLVSSGCYVIIASGNNSNGSNWNRWGYEGSDGQSAPRWQVVNYSDIRNGLGPCGLSPKDERIRFFWKNALGGYDWFNFYGTQDKSVKVSGSRYEKFNDAGNYTPRGGRGIKQLWTQREDEWTVISQPVNRITAVWLEELATSPEVWIEEKQVNPPWRVNDSHQIPVNIKPGSYSTFNSEDNHHFIELKFSLANPRTTQRG
jgi:hypothetical protein